MLTCRTSFGNQNEIYDSGKNMGKLIDNRTLAEIGKKYSKTGAQVALGTPHPPPPIPSLPSVLSFPPLLYSL